ncbi:hypothetical protein A0H81_09657 [Grifola frondosa]|uniref:Protein YOP1 n=1 Tax=Grifola frondosa TaxID=5627 RepID=A0A1C7M086_GRIFR|nr:hypothetical protein A0H81_09657 [Grifola frondosa]
MPLIVPALRLVYTFLNIFETFKTLKVPPPSSRNNGQSSIRALSQRKRAMKGCLTVWIVWCSFLAYERTLDSVVGLFIPFYDEMKSLFILFFMLTRARGSEPIFLHIIRPLVKPYSAPVDAVLDGAHSLGEFITLVFAVPVEFVMGYYRRWTSTAELVEDSDIQSDTASRSNSPPDVDEACRREQLQTEKMSRRTDIAQTKAKNGRASVRDVTPTQSRIARRQQSQLPRPAEAARQTRYPPPPSYDDSVTNPHTGLPTPPSEYSSPSSLTPEAQEIDEWRQYPPFPSAYPPTPLPASSKLPTNVVAPIPLRPSANAAPFSGIPEEMLDDDPANDADTSSAPQGFRKSLQSSRESKNPDSDGDSSDDDDMSGVQFQSALMDIDESVDGNEDEDEEEDDFDITLQTPFPMRQRKPSKERSTLTSTSSESLASKSTALSTTGYGSSLRTRTNSETSASASISDVSAFAGRKRRLQGSVNEDVKDRTRLRDKPPAPKTKPVRAPASPGMRARGPMILNSSVSAAADQDVGSDGSDDGSVYGIKRRRVADAQVERLSRPATRREDTERTIRGPRGAKPISINARPSIRRPETRIPSVRGDAPSTGSRKGSDRDSVSSAKPPLGRRKPLVPVTEESKTPRNAVTVRK